MKRVLTRVVIVFLCLSLLSIGGLAQSIADPMLELVIRESLDQPAAVLTSQELAQVTQLDASNRGIKTLKGIEQLQNLELVDLSYNPIWDLAPLVELPGLKNLNLRGTAVTNIAPVAEIKSLEYLNIHSLGLESLEPIAELINLQTLIMRNVYIGDSTDFLLDLVELQRLNIRNTSFSDSSVLASLMAQGALQDNRESGIRAEVDLRDNPLFASIDEDDYAPLRSYWTNIFDREPKLLPEIGAAGVIINEFMSVNNKTLKDGYNEYPDWIELYNPAKEEVDLTAYYLSDDLDEPLKWQFPEKSKIAGGGYLLVYASGKDTINWRGQIHTNFSISSMGESLLLSNPEGVLVDYVPPVTLQADVSYGRVAVDQAAMTYYSHATPGKENNMAVSLAGTVQPPIFSQVQGMFQEPFQLVLSNADPDVTIYYTLDGTVPTQNSKQYEEPIKISQANVKDGLLSSIKTFGPFDLSRIELDYTGQKQIQAFMPWEPQDVFQATVIRAIAYKPNHLASEVVTHTYFVADDMYTKYSLPILSITTEPDNFFDDRTGIYVAGVHYRDTRPGRPWHNPGNYTQRGIEWEKPVHVAFFEADGRLGFEQDLGARVHGGITRSWPQKSLKFYARSSYEAPGVIEYPVFPGLTANGTGEPLTTFHRLLLRNGGNHWNVDLIADGLMQSLISHTKVDVQAYRPVIVFINGEYWGIQNLRERFDQHYLATNYGVDPDNVVYTTHYDALDYGNPGDERDLHDVINFVQRNDMTQAKNYEHVVTKIDIPNYLDYQVAQIFYGNTDWPGKNSAVWRLKTDYDPDAPYGHDGRWRWMMYDTDFGFGYAHGTSGDFNSLEHATGSRGPLLRHLLSNLTFRNQFINVFADHMNTSFTIERVHGMIDEFEAMLEPEMAEHIQRWGNPGKSVAEWKTNINDLRIWAKNRPEHMRKHIINYFGLKGTVSVNLNSKAKEGYIRINSIDIVPETPGVADAENWTGIYYNDVPITITAYPQPGYEFVRWEGSVSSTAKELEISPKAGISLTAVYRAL